MTLREYFEVTGLTYKHISDKTGLHVHTIQRYTNWKSEPAVSHALLIEEATNGKVKMKMFAEYWKNYKKAKKTYG
jgi:hypothetical protein